MVNVSKKYINKELQIKAWSRFLKEVKGAESTEVLISNLKKFLTQSEITMLEKRLSIPILIERGFSYRDIGRTVDVSQNTISFVKHNLTKRPIIHKTFIPHKGRERRMPYAPRFKRGARFF